MYQFQNKIFLDLKKIFYCFFCFKYLNRISLFIFILFVGSIKIDARNYYINLLGHDAQSGAINQPWKSIGKVNAVVFKPGDSILFNANDTFFGNIYFSELINGKKDSNIVIGSYGNGKAIIKAGNNDGLFCYNNSHISVFSIIFLGNGISTNRGTGVYFYMDLLTNRKLDYIALNGVEAYGFFHAGIRIGSWPSDSSRSGFKNIIINNCIAAENGHAGITIYGYYNTKDTMYSHDSIDISRCKAYNNYGISGHTIHSGNGIVIGQVNHCKISHCVAYENGINSTFLHAGPAGIWAWDSKYVNINHCYAHHNRSQTVDGGGFDLDGGVQNSIMEYNYAHDNDGPGLLIAQFRGARKMKNNIVRFNISENDGEGLGGLIWNGDLPNTLTMENIFFYNNIVVSDTFGSYKGNGANASLAIYSALGTTKNILVSNNVFISKNGNYLLDLDSALEIKFINNVYDDCGSGFKIRQNNIQYNSLSDWRVQKMQEIYQNKNTGFHFNAKLISPGNMGFVGDVNQINSKNNYHFSFPNQLIGKGIYLPNNLGIDNAKIDFYGDSIIFDDNYSPGVQAFPFPTANFDAKNICTGDSILVLNKSKRFNTQSLYIDDIFISDNFSNYLKTYARDSVILKLIVKGKYKSTDTIKKTILIYSLPSATITVNDVCFGKSASISAENKPNHSYQWQIDSFYFFGNNIKLDDLMVKKHFIHLMIKDSITQCINNERDTFNVMPLPNAKFEVILNNNSLLFRAIDSVLSNYTWIVKNQVNGQKTASLIYDKPSSHVAFSIKLMVIDSNGCEAEFDTLYQLKRDFIHLIGFEKLFVFPNPFTDLITVDNAVLNNSYSIIDMKGRILQVGEMDKKSFIIETASLPTGIYVLQILKDGKLFFNEKIVKISN